MVVEFKRRKDFFARELLKRKRLREALAVAIELHDLRFQGGILRELARSHWALREFGAVVELCEADIALAVRAEDIDWEFHSRLLLALYFNKVDLNADDRRGLLKHLERALEIGATLGNDEWQLAAAALMVVVADGLPEQQDASKLFKRILGRIDLMGWSRADDRSRARLAELLSTTGPVKNRVNTVLSSITLSSGYGDHTEQLDGIEYVHHRTFRARLRWESREPQSS